jgi:hypothetical protein
VHHDVVASSDLWTIALDKNLNLEACWCFWGWEGDNRLFAESAGSGWKLGRHTSEPFVMDFPVAAQLRELPVTLV